LIICTDCLQQLHFCCVVTTNLHTATLHRVFLASSFIAVTLYPGATHDFDAPDRSRQSVAANAQARRDALMHARDFFVHYLVETAGD
jgi:hypothetical protein